MDWRNENRPLGISRLRIFDAVARTGTMSAAAALLHLTQPAVTRAVQALESDLGARLIERRRAGSFLTAKGAILARRTERFFQQLDAAIAATITADPHGHHIRRLTRRIADVHIRCLIAIGKARSFRGAAGALGIAEPTLHRPARDLERLVKTPLFRRTPEGMDLSAAGAELARQFTLACVEIATGLEELAHDRSAAGQTMRLGVLPLAPKRQLAAVTEALLRRHPHSRLTIHEASYDDLVVTLRNGAVDVIFGALRAPAPFEDLREESLFDDPYGIVCRKDHPLARRSHVAIADIKKYNWIFPTPSLPRRAMLDAILAAWNLPQRVQIETNSLGSLIADLAASDHISLLPRAYDDHSGLLTVLDIPVPHPQRLVGLTTRRDWLPTDFHADCLALLRKTAADNTRGRENRA